MVAKLLTPGRLAPCRSLALALLVCSSFFGCGSDGRGSTPWANPTLPKPQPPTFTLFALAEVRGQTEPCGCTTDPLGDIARTVALVDAARAQGPVLVTDAGSLLYSKSPIPTHLAEQEELKADLLATLYRDRLKADAIGIGPMDLAKGVDRLRLPRVLSNATAGAPPPNTIPHLIKEVGGATVGVLAIATAEAVPGLAVDDPVAAGKRVAAELRQSGARVVIGLVSAAHRRQGVQLVREIGAFDIAVIGLGAQTPEPTDVASTAEREGETWMVFPANRGQTLVRMEITLRPDGGVLADAVGPSAATERIQLLDQRLQDLAIDFTNFAHDTEVDPVFLDAKKKERDQLRAERDQLAANPLRIPATGSYFTMSMVRINKKLACDAQSLAAKTEYDRAAGAANAAAAAALPPAKVPKGTATYVGVEACGDCHDEAVKFWQGTRHARAWPTLEERGKHLDYDCIGCHITGYDKPGGASLAKNETLRNVQCETCHGPGSIHIAKDGAVDTIKRVPDPTLCASQCHTKDHSDTFDFDPYMRDILGPGHGEARRKVLGAGKTGRELRAAGLAKAGTELGAGCSK